MLVIVRIGCAVSILSGIASVILLAIGPSYMPTSLSATETDSMGRRSSQELNDLLLKRQAESLGYRLSIAGGACAGFGIVGFFASWICLCWLSRYEYSSQVHVEPQIVSTPPQAPSSGSTAPRLTHSPSTTAVPPPTSSPSPYVTFRVDEQPPPLGQKTEV